MMRTAMLSFGLAAVMALSGGLARAQDEKIGMQLYQDNCAVCHGVTAKGDGDMAGVLKVPVPDLTLLAKKNDGNFPMLEVIHIIDGRTGIRSHGNPMPLFGDMFGATAAKAPDMDEIGPNHADPYGGVVEARGRVMSVALYLESIQR